jgi:hypothetical protein
VWVIGWHYDHLTTFQMNGFAGDNDFRFAFNEIDQGIKWCRMLT